MKTLILAGTSEGRTLAEFCEEKKMHVTVCVATEYGEAMLIESEYVKVLRGRRDLEEMKYLLLQESFTHVIDATHPYAVEVTENIKQACIAAGVSYMRLLREANYIDERCVQMHAIESAVDFLDDAAGNILITTGSKELKKYAKLTDMSRLYPRILPDAKTFAECESIGILRQNVIGMQGSFSKELNKAMLIQIQAKYIVTKEAGAAGGFTEKINAALECGVIPIVIMRPTSESGFSLERIKENLLELAGLKENTEKADKVIEIGIAEKQDIICKTDKQQVIIAGIGMGTAALMTEEVKNALEKADICIGAKRMLDAVAKFRKPVFTSYKGEEIVRFIKEHNEYKNIVILMSGDVGFFSGAKKLLQELDEWKPTLLTGISSLSYFCSKLKTNWDNVKICSHHGMESNVVDFIRENEKVYAIMGGGSELKSICNKLVDYGMNDVCVSVGENLSYLDEKIISGTPEEIEKQEIGNLCVVLFEQKNFMPCGYYFGISDDCFIRDKVPMTKEEIRCISLSKLKLHKDSVIYDIGAGTGSVSVEMALAAIEGKVYAIEKKEKAVSLIEENKRKFKIDNLEVIQGMAPSALADLEIPTHAFIGGSLGKMEGILNALFEKNPSIRIVINAIALETIGQVTELIEKLHLEAQIVQVTVARGNKLGDYHLMNGENPVTIFTLWRKEVYETA